MGSFRTRSMEDNCQIRPIHAGPDNSACESFSPVHQQTTFRASKFRLQTSSEQQRWIACSRQPQLREHISTHEAAVPHRVAVTSFSLGDAGSSSSSRASSAKQPGSAKASVPSSSKSSMIDFDLTYTYVENWKDSGFVPTITVGSVFTLTEER